MKSTHRTGLILLLFMLAGAATVHAADKPWITDFAEAKKTATKEGKDILIEFTGSDW